jgi:indolepyruvate ferredoxin oxidoreductase beta subunit
MARVAEQSGSVISAALFGALAGAGALPFPRAAYEATIRAAGVGVEPSLAAFARGFEEATAPAAVAPAAKGAGSKHFAGLAPIGHAGFDALVSRARATLPAAVHDMVAAGLRRVVDFQDPDYGREYLDLVDGMLAVDRAAGGEAKEFALTRAVAKHLAVAMAYDDVIRVADLKTRSTRFKRVRAEVAAKPDQLVYTTEFMHPRMEEAAGTLPMRLGAFIESRPRLFTALDRLINRGQRVRTGTVLWFVTLYALAGLRRFRRGTLRHARETTHRDLWLERISAVAATDYALAVELAQTRRLIKGYSDTHARGESKFDRVMAAAGRLEGRPDAAQWVRRLREAALRDEDGAALAGALATVESFL